MSGECQRCGDHTLDCRCECRRDYSPQHLATRIQYFFDKLRSDREKVKDLYDGAHEKQRKFEEENMSDEEEWVMTYYRTLEEVESEFWDLFDEILVNR